MPERKSDEPWLFWCLRYMVEEPRIALAFLGFIAAAYMYFDLMSFVRENTEVQRQSATQLQEINVRLGHLEREHEMARESKNP